MAKRKSVRWSLKDIKKIEEFVKNAVALGGTEKDGLIDAAKHFGVTRNAVQCRLWKYKHGLSTGGLKQRTTKKALKRKPYGKRGPYKKRFNPKNIVPEPSGRSITIKIKDVRIDLKKGTITILY